MASLILQAHALSFRKCLSCSEDYFSDLTIEDVAACIEYANKLVANEDVEYKEDMK